MQRVTLSITDALSEALDEIRHDRGYQTRSEAVRDLVRDGIERWRSENGDGAFCVANLSYVVDRRTRALVQRIAEMQHAHHDLVVASMAIRLDHFHTLESVMLRGERGAVSAFADQIRAERGVRFGSVNLLSVEADCDHDSQDHHVHGDHPHLSPVI